MFLNDILAADPGIWWTTRSWNPSVDGWQSQSEGPTFVTMAPSLQLQLKSQLKSMHSFGAMVALPVEDEELQQ